MISFGPRAFAVSRIGHIGQSETREMFTHMVASLLPNGQQHALTFMIA